MQNRQPMLDPGQPHREKTCDPGATSGATE